MLSYEAEPLAGQGRPPVGRETQPGGDEQAGERRCQGRKQTSISLALFSVETMERQ